MSLTQIPPHTHQNSKILLSFYTRTKTNATKRTISFKIEDKEVDKAQNLEILGNIS